MSLRMSLKIGAAAQQRRCKLIGIIEGEVI
jgi:hypothetical protein